METGKTRLEGVFALVALVSVFMFAPVTLAGEVMVLKHLADAHNVIEKSPLIRFEADVAGVMEWKYSENLEGNTAIVLKLESNGGEPMYAYMGPTRYLKNRACAFAVGDRIVIEGAEALVEDQTILIAKSYQSKDLSFTLRDDDGTMAMNR